MTDRVEVEETATESVARLAARGLVIAGGVFWMIAGFSGPYVFHDTGFTESLGTAIWPLAATVVILAIGWTHERLAAVLLFAAAATLMAWGILSQWEVGVWVLLGFVLFAPILIAAFLFLFAARAEHRREYVKEQQPATPAAAKGATAPNGAEKDAPSGNAPQPRGAMLLTWGIGVTVGLLAFFFAVPMYFTATPKQCASCHEMEEYYESWRTSSHQEAAPSCLHCHVEPGFLNLVRYEVEFYGEIAGHLAGADVKMAGVTTPDLESCQRGECHTLDREASYSEEVLIAHKAHVEDEKIACSRCHPGAAHEGVGGRSTLSSMEQCSECHVDQMGECDYCHTEDVVPGAPESH